jgi:hypothetical protein
MTGTRFSRRKFLLLLLSLLSLDWVVSQYRMAQGAPAGWKTERWQAGFGSWCCGGYLVAYDISIPKEYDFMQKCGKAWISNDDDVIDDFLIKLAYFGTSSPRYDEQDLDDYLKTGAAHSAESLGWHTSDIHISAERSYNVGALRFSRSDILLGGETHSPAGQEKTTGSPARGFRLKGSGMSIIAELNSPQIDEVNEKIIRSMRPVKGFGIFDALTGSVPFLNGC